MASTTNPSTVAADTWNLLREMLVNLETLDPEGSDALQELIKTSGVRGGALRAMRHLPLEGTMSMRELVLRLHCDKAYATHVVDELEQHDYVARTVDPANRRTKVVGLTPRGRPVAREARLLHEKPPSTLSELSPDDLETLQKLLQRVKNLGRRHPAITFDQPRHGPEAPRNAELRNLRRRGGTLR